MIISNSVLFSLIHIDFHDLSIATPVSLLSRFGGHLIALWLVINYKLIYAILVHALWNGLLYSLSFFAEENELHDIKRIENDAVKIEYKIAENYKPFSINLSKQDTLIYETIKIKDLIEISHENSDSIFQIYEEPPHRYDLKIIVKDRFMMGQNDVIVKEAIDLLAKDSLLIRK